MLLQCFDCTHFIQFPSIFILTTRQITYDLKFYGLDIGILGNKEFEIF